MASNLNLQSMKIFLAVFEEGSVGVAARALGMSQSGLSTALARLRRELGDELFVSTATGMRATTRAKELVGPMREAVQCIEQRILNAGAFDAATDTREFKIALTDMAEAMYMARILNAVARAAPHVRLRSVALAQAQQQRALSEGQVDLALGYLPDLLASEFVRRKIAQHVYVCICSASNRDLIEDFSLRKYCEARHVVIDSSSRSQGLLEGYLHKRGIHRIVALATPHAMSLPEIIAGTDLIASIPDSLAQFYAELRRLKRMPLPFRSPVFENHMHWSKSVHNDPANRWLRATVIHALTVGAG